jgi:hypothetical protein
LSDAESDGKREVDGPPTPLVEAPERGAGGRLIMRLSTGLEEEEEDEEDVDLVGLVGDWGRSSADGLGERAVEGRGLVRCSREEGRGRVDSGGNLDWLCPFGEGRFCETADATGFWVMALGVAAREPADDRMAAREVFGGVLPVPGVAVSPRGRGESLRMAAWDPGRMLPLPEAVRFIASLPVPSGRGAPAGKLGLTGDAVPLAVLRRLSGRGP